MAIFIIVIYLYNHQTMVTESVFILGWTLATNTRYPFPEYAPKGVVREWINLITFYRVNIWTRFDNKLHVVA